MPPRERLERARHAQLEEELRHYVAVMAGSAADLDEALEEAGAETLLHSEE